MKRLSIPKSVRYWVLISVGIALAIASLTFFMMAISYMEHAMIATSLLTVFIGFVTLSSSLYVLRLAAYVYSVEAGSREEA